MSGSNAKNSLLQLAIAGVLLTSAVAASAAVITITNASNHEIPLKTGSTVQFDASGNILAECALNASNVCEALSSGGAIGAPTASLSRADTDSNVTAGESISLKWSSTDATVCHASATGPATTSWGGAKTTANATGQTIALSTAGTYTFSLQCFNSAGGSAIQDVSVVVGPATNPDPQPAGCSITDPLIAPNSLTKVTKTWTQAWSSPNGKYVPTYPDGIGYPVPIGAEKNGYTVIPFTPNANQSVKIFFDGAQPSSATGYNPARTAMAMLITISPCQGDLRYPRSASLDPFEKPACRIFANTGSLYFTTISGSAACTLEAGKTYYMNVAAIDTSDGLQAGENTCGSSYSGCDVQATHKPQ